MIEYTRRKNTESLYDNAKFIVYIAASLCFEFPQMVIRHSVSHDGPLIRSSPYISLEQICDFFKPKSREDIID